MRRIFLSFANFKMPRTLLGWSFPISSIMQCSLKSLNRFDALSLKTFSSMIFIIALTSTSVPSEPTFDIFSTQFVSLSFSTILNCNSKEWASMISLSLKSLISFTNCFSSSTAFLFLASLSCEENRFAGPRSSIFSSLNFFISFRR